MFSRPLRIAFITMGLITLGSCDNPAPLTTAEDLRIDPAMARVKAEQDRTDRVEVEKQAAKAELQQQRPSDTPPILERPAFPIEQYNLGQHSLTDVQLRLPSGNIADSSRSAN